jgi:hypothetical protein
MPQLHRGSACAPTAGEFDQVTDQFGLILIPLYCESVRRDSNDVTIHVGAEIAIRENESQRDAGHWLNDERGQEEATARADVA